MDSGRFFKQSLCKSSLNRFFLLKEVKGFYSKIQMPLFQNRSQFIHILK